MSDAPKRPNISPVLAKLQQGYSLSIVKGRKGGATILTSPIDAVAFFGPHMGTHISDTQISAACDDLMTLRKADGLTRIMFLMPKDVIAAMSADTRQSLVKNDIVLRRANEIANPTDQASKILKGFWNNATYQHNLSELQANSALVPC